MTTKYRTTFAGIFGSRSGNPYFYMEKLCPILNRWEMIGNDTYSAKVAQEKIEAIIEGEKEWVVIPKEVITKMYK